MGYLDQTRVARIQKRRRKSWYRKDPGTPEGREAYRIAERYEGKFASAFRAALRGMWTPEVEREVRRAIRTRSVANVIDAVPMAQDADSKAWDGFKAGIQRAYGEVLTAAGRDSAERMNAKFKTKVWFSVDPAPLPTGAEEVKKGREDVAAAARGMMVPINPYGIKWMKERATHLIDQRLTKSQREVVTAILESSFERGLRAEEIFDEIKANIGLTRRWNQAVANRREKLTAAGYNRDEVESRTEKYREELLGKRAQMIARTETLTAQAEGRNEVWRVADEAGLLPEVQRRWLSAGPTGNPDAPCEICLELDGKTARLGEPYESMFLGAVDMPGEDAHPG